MHSGTSVRYSGALLNSVNHLMESKAVKLQIDKSTSVSGLVLEPKNSVGCFVLAHGAGAGMRHLFLESISQELAQRRVATLRFQFPYMESGGRRPDSPAVAQSAVRAAVAEAAKLMPNLPLFAGGKSFGGRMTSQAQAAAPLPGVRGLIFLGFPLHPAGKPSDARGQHLFDVRIPMLFVQGTRDLLAELSLIRKLTGSLDAMLAKVELIDEADHSFHVPARTGLTDADVLKRMAALIASWIQPLLN